MKNLKRRSQLGEQDIDRRLILKSILRINVMGFGIWISGRLL
jgi:hypothetical protein